MDDPERRPDTANSHTEDSQEESQSLKSTNVEVDRLCDRFEAAWREGKRPQIRDFLADVPEEAKAAAYRDLLVAELGFRWAAGEEPTPEEYKQAFPQHSDLVDAVFDPRKTGVGTVPTESEIPPPTATFQPDTPAAAEGAPEQIGRYRVQKLLGEGGFGKVYRAHDDELNRPVAIKVPHRHRVSRPEDEEQYLAEAQVVANLDHPGIVPVHDVGRTAHGLCFVVSKFVEGSDLATRIKEGRLNHHESAQLVATVAEALHYAHLRGLVHRDVKPANILLDLAGKAYVTDFGLALKEEDFGKRGGIAGTVLYMSPEQARGESHRVDGRSDVFSLGVVFYELLTGRRPFRGDSQPEVLGHIVASEPRPPRQRDDTVPKELERICLRALSKRASDRYTTALDFAEELRHYLETAPPSEQPAARPSADEAVSSDKPSSERPLKIVPKGLRSFDAEDADFFLELLPGPRDRDGLPDSIRFWKNRIEEPDLDKTFAVGLIYGPSGCGKSSLMKAGLLPRVADSIIAVYIEATAEETEARLLRGLRKHCPDLPDGLDLAETLAALRRGRVVPSGKKVLVVLDQFEQWLHGKREEENTELVQALRQCDGEHVQCIVMVRADFWMPASRFMQELEIRLLEGRNSGLVDLFDLRHAKRVLTALGRAFGTLPEKVTELTSEQGVFLEQAISALAREGKVVCVRLALFAEMIKGKSWVPATLKKVGGTEGIGVTFLEETFSAATAPPEHRLHQKAARGVLKALLPEVGTDIKGHMRSYGELLEASGYAHRPRDFEGLLRILDGELRLVTPTDPESSPDESDSEVETTAGERYYQLTHDYLVPPLREWLNRKRRETRRGRAELLLEERAQQWGQSRQDRLLPSPLESLSIALYTRRAERTECQREMLRRAFAFRGCRLGLGVLLVASLTFVFWILIPKPPSQFQLLQTFADPAESTRARVAAFDRLHVNDVRIFPQLIRTLEDVDDPDLVRHALAQLSELAEQSAQSDQVDTQASVRDPLVGLLLTLLDHDSDDVQLEAFSVYSGLSPPEQTVETIRLHAGQVGQQLAATMVRYLNELPLAELPSGARSKVLWNMTALIKDDQNDHLAAACVAKLDGLPPERLLGWLVEAYESSDVKTAAKEGLVPYASKTNAGLKRVHAIGRYVEDRLVELVPRRDQEIATTFELEFLVQTLGEIRKLGRLQYEKGSRTVAYMLERRDLLQDTSVLDTLIETFALLNRDKRLSLAPLRDILTSTGGSRPVREAAAVAVGDLEDLESLDGLKDLATNPDQPGNFFNLQVRAAESLRRIGSSLKRQQPTSPQIEEIVTVLRRVLEKHEEQPVDVVREALEGCGKLGDSGDVDLIFPLILDSSFYPHAVRAILSLLSGKPAKTSEIVHAYLRWRTTIDPRLSPPGNGGQALIGFDLYHESTAESEYAAKSVARALAEAQANLEEESCRIHAGRLLTRFLRADGAPEINATANEPTRAAQLDKWDRWWEETESHLRLISGSLQRVSEEP